MINASGQIGMNLIMDLHERVLEGKGFPQEWKTIIILIFKGKGDANELRILQTEIA